MHAYMLTETVMTCDQHCNAVVLTKISWLLTADNCHFRSLDRTWSNRSIHLIGRLPSTYHPRVLHSHMFYLIILITCNLGIAVSIKLVVCLTSKCPLLPSSIHAILLDVTGGTTRRKGATAICVVHLCLPRHWGQVKLKFRNSPLYTYVSPNFGNPPM